MLITEEHIQRQLKDVLHVLKQRATFLAMVRTELERTVEAHKEFFRRPPESRVKPVTSIVRKLNDDGVPVEHLMEGLVGIEDLAGIRMTIATQDQYERARAIIEQAMDGIATVWLKKSWRWSATGGPGRMIVSDGPKMEAELEEKTGYCADHLILTSLTDPAARAELQVRTLAHDLWAVFSHYEAYKVAEPLPASRRCEVVNYSRLLDVVDYYATQIRHRKEEDADERHRMRARAGTRGRMLTVAGIRSVLTTSTPNESRADVEFETMKLCQLLREIGDYNVFTEEDLTEAVGNREFLDVLTTAVIRANEEKRTRYRMEITDVVRICAKSRNSFMATFRDGSVDNGMRAMASVLVESWHLEKWLDELATGESSEDDGARSAVAR